MDATGGNEAIPCGVVLRMGPASGNAGVRTPDSTVSPSLRVRVRSVFNSLSSGDQSPLRSHLRLGNPCRANIDQTNLAE